MKVFRPIAAVIQGLRDKAPKSRPYELVGHIVNDTGLKEYYEKETAKETAKDDKPVTDRMTIAIRSMELLDNHFLSDWLYQPDFSDYLNGDICRPTGYSQWGYPHEFFRKDMERLGIVA